jgi:superfamily II DNA or RNA helicase
MIPELRVWQKEALCNWLPAKQGIAKVVTGAGKTVFGLTCYESIRREISDLQLLIVVPTVPLLDQWIEESSALLDIRQDQVSAYGGGRSGTSKNGVHVTVLNTARNLSSEISSEGKWMLIVDECHRAGSQENRRALQGNFLATLGLSATPERQYDSFFDEIIEPALGNIIYEYTYADALRDKVLSPFQLLNYRVPLSQYEEQQIQRVQKAIAIRFAEGYSIHDEVLKRLFMRRARISQQAESRIPTVLAIIEEHRGKRGLIFHESIDAVETITSVLQAKKHRIASYHSRLNPVARLQNLHLFRTGQLDLLATCRSLDEGLDVPDAEIGLIASATSSTRQRIQRMGRVLRPSHSKTKATVFTLFALDSERDRLEAEVSDLEGLAQSRWFLADYQ